MGEIKIGDKVRCVCEANSPSGLKLNDIYTVIDVYDRTGGLKLKELEVEGLGSGFFRGNRFELVVGH